MNRKSKILKLDISLLVLLILLIFQIGIIKPVKGQEIMVENADAVIEQDLVNSTGLDEAIGTVDPRIIAEYIDALIQNNLLNSTLLNDLLEGVDPRIIVEYADSIVQEDLVNSTILNDLLTSVESRIIVEYIDTLIHYGLLNSTILDDLLNGVGPRIIVEYADYLNKQDLKEPTEPSEPPSPENPAEGKGIWIWHLSYADNGNITKIIQRAQAVGLDWIAIKGGDGTILWEDDDELTSEIINQIHSAGIKVLGWQYVYGDDPIQEANVSIKILDKGVDGFIVNAEAEYEGKTAEAIQYMTELRTYYPDAFIAYSTFPIIDYHMTFPYIEFGNYCDVAMPQAYWKELAVTPESMVDWMEEQWDKWHETWDQGGYNNSIKPLIPTGQGWNVDENEIVIFCNLLQDHGYTGMSLWRYGNMTDEMWDAYAGSFDIEPPVLNHPADIDYVEGDTGHQITWTVTDAHPDTYKVMKDGIQVITDSWSSGDSIIIDVDGLYSGNYNYTIIIRDTYNNIATDIVFVSVTEPVEPSGEISGYSGLIIILILAGMSVVVVSIKRQKCNINF